MGRTRFEASLDKRRHLSDCEEKGIVADSMEVRTRLIEKMHAGEMTLEEVQAELKRIKKNAKKNGQITRTQAFKQG